MYAPYADGFVAPRMSTIDRRVKQSGHTMFDKPQIINIAYNPTHKLVFCQIHNFDTKTNIGISTAFSKAKWCIQNAQKNASALHGMDSSFYFALWNTNGEGWYDQLVTGGGNTVQEFTTREALEARVVEIYKQYEEIGYTVVGNAKYKNKAGDGSKGNQGWGKAKLANIKLDAMKELISKMLVGTAHSFHSLPRTDWNEIYAGVYREGGNLITKGDLFEHLRTKGYVR